MSFSPSDVFDLLILEADDIAGNDGDAVSSWTDETVNGFNLAAVNAPTLKKGANGINSKNVVRFDGVNDEMNWSGSSLNMFKNRSGMTVAMVIKPTNDTQVAAVLGFSTNTSGSARGAFILSNTTSKKMDLRGRRLDADSGQNTTSANDLGTSAILLVGVWDYANTIQRLYENGTQAATKNDFQTAGSTSNTASAHGGLSDSNFGAANFFAGDYAAIYIASSVLSDANRNLFGGYIQTKYGLTIAGATSGGTVIPVAMHHYKNMRR